MKKIIHAGVFIISTIISLFISVGVVRAESATNVNADITASTTWVIGGSPYILQKYININPGVILNIDPGVEVISTTGALIVKGSLNALGNASSSVVFTNPNIQTASSTSVFSYVKMTGGLNPLYATNSNIKIDHLLASSTQSSLYFANSIADISSSTFQNSDKMLQVYNGGLVTVRDSLFRNGTTRKGPIWVYNSGVLNISSSTIDTGLGNGVHVYQKGNVSLDNVVIKNMKNAGIVGWDNGNISLNKTIVTGNDIGLEIDGPISFTSKDSAFYGNTTYGIANYTAGAIDAKNIWWGDATGPYKELLNPTGVGNEVGSNVNFTPWLTEDPFSTPKCCSNVAFIPGLEASRLYTSYITENTLWEPNRNADVEKLYMNASGTSIRKDIYTRDVIDYIGGLFFKVDIYQNFIAYMNGLVAGKTINAWKPLPYDWRLGLGDVVNNGVESADGKISYLADTLPEVSYMIDSIQKLAESSHNGKVTLVTHSNGGLVAKVLIQKLQELKAQGKSNLVDKIDKVIMISAPQLGSTDAITALLHGYNINFLYGLVLDESHGRAMSSNMPAVYNLLPSQKYFDLIKEPIVNFASSTDSLNFFSRAYGRNITDYDTLKKFLTGFDGRAKPSITDTVTPDVLNGGLIAQAEAQHGDIDNWQFPASIEVTQVAGWGVQTVKGLQYSGNRSCWSDLLGLGCKDVLAMTPMFSVEGDGTVLYPSALESNNKQLYFNVRDYNSPDIGKNENRKHADIFETDSIDELVKNILIGKTDLPQYITKTKPVTNDSLLVVSLTASTTLTAKDALGNRTGFVANPNPTSDLKLIEQNIPNSFYADFAGTKYVGVNVESDAKITFQGSGYGTFNFTSTVTQGDGPATVTTFTDIPVTPQMQGEVINVISSAPVLALDVDGNGMIDATTTPTQSFDPILYLEVMKKTVDSFDLKKVQEKTLISKINQLENLIKKGKIKNAEKRVQGFIKKIDRKGNKMRKVSVDERTQIIQMLTTLTNSLI